MSVFKTIAEIQPSLPGWCKPEKAEVLACSIIALRAKLSVEIGVFGGSSFIPIALAHKSIGMGVAWGVEPWSRQAAMEAQTEPASVKWWSELNYDKLRGDFMAVIEKQQLSDYVKIIQQRSREVMPPQNIDLLHVDGAHSDEAVMDVKRWAANVRPGGLCFMDDISWHGGGVKKATEVLKQMGFRECFYMDTGAMYQRV